MAPMQGQTPVALWERLKLDGRHLSATGRLALVTDGSWRDPFAMVSKPFTGAEVGHSLFPMPLQACYERTMDQDHSMGRHGA